MTDVSYHLKMLFLRLLKYVISKMTKFKTEGKLHGMCCLIFAIFVDASWNGFSELCSLQREM